MLSHARALCAFAFLFHCGWSVWERNIFPIWLANVTGSTVSVGLIQSIQGIVAVLAGPIVGTAIDVFSRASIKRFMIIEGMFSLGFLFFSLYTFDVNRSWVLYLGMGFWGILLSTQGTLVDTLIADYTEKGKERTEMYAIKSTFWRMGGLCGQIFNLAYFYTSGDSWSVIILEKIMYVGLGIMALSLGLVACCLVTKLPSESKPNEKSPLSPTAPLLIPDDLDKQNVDSRRQPEPGMAPPGKRCLQPKWVIFCSVLLRVFGKGIAMRLIPIYFQQHYLVAPTTLTCKYPLLQI